jgi:hypothetical protein
LSEAFIEKWIDRLNWVGICKTQKLSIEFLKKHHALCDNNKEQIIRNFFIDASYKIELMKKWGKVTIEGKGNIIEYSKTSDKVDYIKEFEKIIEM